MQKDKFLMKWKETFNIAYVEKYGEVMIGM
jgi:hypothetical protein